MTPPRALVAALLALLLLPAAARAEAVTGAQLRALAAQAAGDPAALERLRGVDAGRRAAGRPRGGARRRGAELRARLEALAQSGGGAGATRARAGGGAGHRRRPALHRHRGARAVPRRAGAARRLGRAGARPDPVARRPAAGRAAGRLGAARAADRRDRRCARGAEPAAARDRRAPRRRRRVGRRPRGRRSRRARPARARGGGARRPRAGAAPRASGRASRGSSSGRSLSTGEVARVGALAGFDRAAARFDEVVYGGRPAAAADVDDARAAWEAALSGRRAARSRHPLRVLLALVVAFVALIVAIDRLAPTPSGPEGSSYATAPEGAAAYAELLHRAGHPVRRVRAPLAERAPDPGSTLVVLDPERVEPDEARGDRALRGGGRAARRRGRHVALARARARRAAGVGPGAGRATRASIAPVPETAGVTHGRVRRGRPLGGAAAARCRSSPAPRVRSRRSPCRARGGAVLLADASPLANAQLARADNAAFALAAAGEAGGRSRSSRRSTATARRPASRALPGRAVWVLAGLALAALALVWSMARRFGPPEDEAARARPAAARLRRGGRDRAVGERGPARDRGRRGARRPAAARRAGRAPARGGRAGAARGRRAPRARRRRGRRAVRRGRARRRAGAREAGGAAVSGHHVAAMSENGG